MESKNKYQDAPKHYLLCYNTTCKKAKTCLHQIVACENINKEKIVQCVNPSVNSGENCDYYKADRIVRIAYGMEHTFEQSTGSRYCKDSRCARQALRERILLCSPQWEKRHNTS